MKWNDQDQRHETTEMSIRAIPDNIPPRVKKYFVMCDPYKGTCKEEQCTFAHGEAERKAWNAILRRQREPQGNQKKKAVFIHLK